MTLSPIERAARALCENPSEDPDEMIVMSSGESWPRWKAEVWRVRAVLEAVSEPSRVMIADGKEIMDVDLEQDHHPASPESIWSTMIDAALAER